MTVQKIYDITMALIDEMLDSGAVDYASTKDYTARTPGILTILDTNVVSYLKRMGAKAEFLDPLNSMEDEIDLDDEICMGVLPYGLAAKLLMQEDTSLSNYFSNLYNSSLQDIAINNAQKAEWVERDNYYGLLRAGD